MKSIKYWFRLFSSGSLKAIVQSLNSARWSKWSLVTRSRSRHSCSSRCPWPWSLCSTLSSRYGCGVLPCSRSPRVPSATTKRLPEVLAGQIPPGEFSRCWVTSFTLNYLVLFNFVITSFNYTADANRMSASNCLVRTREVYYKKYIHENWSPSSTLLT